MSGNERLQGALRVIELDAEKFVETVREVRRLSAIAGQELSTSTEQASPTVRMRIGETIRELREHLALMGAQSAWVAANRFAENLADESHEFAYSDLKQPLVDIESRFSDHLQFIKLFVVRGEQMFLLGAPNELMGEETARLFPKAWFDCEEAAKCILVQRPTAAIKGIPSHAEATEAALAVARVEIERLKDELQDCQNELRDWQDERSIE